MGEHLGDILKHYREKKDWNQSRMADFIGVSLRTYQAMEKTGDVSKAETMDRIRVFLKAEHLGDTQKLAEPQPTYTPKEKHLQMRVKLKDNARSVPVSIKNGKASAGTVQLINDEPELILEYIDAPFIGIVDGVIEVVGDSMYPTLKNGARIAVEKIADPQLLYWGECYYVIDSNYQGVVKRIEPGEKEDHIILNSDNPRYKPVKRYWKNIVSVFKIKADITKH